MIAHRFQDPYRCPLPIASPQDLNRRDIAICPKPFPASTHEYTSMQARVLVIVNTSPCCCQAADTASAFCR